MGTSLENIRMDAIWTRSLSFRVLNFSNTIDSDMLTSHIYSSYLKGGAGIYDRSSRVKVDSKYLLRTSGVAKPGQARALPGHQTSLPHHQLLE